MTKALTLYDLTRQWLREALADRLPGQADIENMLTAYAYWVCSEVDQRGVDWETAVRKCADYAARDAELEIEAEQREFALLRHTLPKGHPILDIGAGWGRLAALYNELDMHAVYVEPSTLGVQLMRRSQPGQIVRAVGEALPFPSATFPTVFMGWVVHHHASGLDANSLLRETARVLTAGGLLFSIEPIRASFDMALWQAMLSQHGVDLRVREVNEYFQAPNTQGEIERHTLIIGEKP